MPYTMCKLKNQYVAALYALDKERQSRGEPSHWLPYLNVRNADDVVRKASQDGGKVVTGPFDVLDVGRMAVVQDPTSAYVAIWQARKHIGARIINEPGAMCWVEGRPAVLGHVLRRQRLRQRGEEGARAARASAQAARQHPEHRPVRRLPGSPGRGICALPASERQTPLLTG